MHRYDRISALTFAGSCCLAAGIIVSGCRKIPEHIMNSPPANHAAPDAATPKKSAPPPVDLEPPALHPEDRLASHVDAAASEIDDAPKSEVLREAAVDALARMGAASVPSLVKELNSQDARQRQRAAEVLALIGPAAVDAAEPLVERLEDSQEDRGVQLACATALKEIGPALWPPEPEPYLALNLAEPLPLLSGGESDNDQVAALAQRRETRRIEYDQRNARRRQLHEEHVQEYQRRRAIAARAVDVLKELALQD